MAYYDPKSIAPILQQGGQEQAKYNSQVTGAAGGLGALGQVAQTGFEAAAAQDKKRLTLELAKRDFANYLALPPQDQANPENLKHAQLAASTLGMAAPMARTQNAAPSIVEALKTEAGITGEVAGSKEDMPGLETAARLRSATRQRNIDAVAATKKAAADKKVADAASSAGKRLPAPTVLVLNEGKNVSRLLPEVDQAIEANKDIFGPVEGRLRGLNPYDKRAQTVDARMRSASQAFGKFMEGGVLRKEDEEKYRKMFPQLGDEVTVAKNKLAIVRRQLAQKYNDDKATMGKSGYDVSGFIDLEVPESLFEGAAAGDDIDALLLKHK